MSVYTSRSPTEKMGSGMSTSQTQSSEVQLSDKYFYHYISQEDAQKIEQYNMLLPSVKEASVGDDNGEMGIRFTTLKPFPNNSKSLVNV